MTTTSSNDFGIKYNWIDGVEPPEEYVPEGYHPILIGDVLHDRYRIVDKLGYGGYSTVWLARDTRSERYVAVKVGVASLETDSPLREIKSLRALSAPLPASTSAQRKLGRDAVPRLLDEFEVHGPNGTHVCYATDPARCNLKQVSYSRLVPLDVARALSGGLALALAYTHSQGYAHGDIHLQNILLKLPAGFNPLSIEQFYEKYGKPKTVTITRQDGKPLLRNAPPKVVRSLYLGKKAQLFTLADVRVILSDFGEAFAPGSDFRPGERCATPLAFRPPEARFEPQAALSYPADIWSLATAIWEIISMKAPFSNEWVTEDETFFDKDGHPIKGREVWPPIHQAFEDWVQKYRRMHGMGEFGEEETAALLHLMRRMLAFRPEDRPTVDEVLRSEWMVKWVLPDFEKSLQAQQ